MNGGQCVDTVTGYMCECPVHFKGTNCETVSLTISIVNPTANNGDGPTYIVGPNHSSGIISMYSSSIDNSMDAMTISGKVAIGNDVLPPTDQVVPNVSDAKNGEHVGADCFACPCSDLFISM